MTEPGFLRELIDYLRMHRGVWLTPLIVIVLLLALAAVVLYGPGALLSGVYQDF